MTLEEMMGHVIDQLTAGLTGGTADLPLPANMQLNFMTPGMPLHESFFDFALAGPFSGPTPLTLDYFTELVETLMGPQDDGADEDSGDAEATGMGLGREAAIQEAKRMYQQHLLGCWEQWSRLVDFIPSSAPTPESTEWSHENGAGAHRHVSVVYGQTNRKLSTVYKDTLRMCQVADDALTEAETATIERMKALLTVQVEREDFLTGELVSEPQPSPAMLAYTTYKQAYEEAVIDYATKLARAQNGTAEDAILFQQSGGIYRQRAIQAQRDWIARGYKNDIERAQAAISHITGQSMVKWKDDLLQVVANNDNSTSGAFGYAFPPAGIIPGSFARSDGWSRFSERSMRRTVETSRSTRSGGGRFGLSLGVFTIGGGGGGGKTERSLASSFSDFGLDFEYTAAEIVRYAFEPTFFLSGGWRPDPDFVRDYGTDVHSDGKPDPDGALIGYPTKALFVRNLVIHSSEIATLVESQESTVNGGGFVGIGPFVIGGRYQQSNASSQRNYQSDGASIVVHGLQLVGFMSALFPRTANPSPDVTRWV